ncbi:diguanylate cyclase [Bacillus sp. DNRA2]|uniref:GGDEF domain-containing protein n=1 Tax=Bacillus sp. DNRA2 TaxID=2723053 RepID=UPI00145C97E8|nr:diguanylate cyclase [Bacillus sp. DNRA2]NMD69960.1 diguanylate cyclase [Bacillus sp. DNRA2]
MIIALFIHGCIVIALFFLMGTFFRHIHIENKTGHKLVLGFLLGIIGSLLIRFNIPIAQYIILDLRHVPIIISAVFGGTIPTFITAFIIAFSRIIFFPISYSTYASVITLIIITIFSGVVTKRRYTEFQKVIVMIAFSTIANGIMFWFVLQHFGYGHLYLQKIIFFYIPMSLLGGFLAFYLFNYITITNHSYQMLKQQAEIDYLTGLRNVRQFHHLLERLLAKASETEAKLGLLFIDIDHFKKINDTYGHPAGDEVLRGFSRILINSNPFNHTVFRNGGEEFSIIVPTANEAQLISLAESIRTKIECHIFHLPSGEKIHITASIGMVLNSNINNITDLIYCADQALYHAKNSGRNRVVIFKEE